MANNWRTWCSKMRSPGKDRGNIIVGRYWTASESPTRASHEDIVHLGIPPAEELSTSRLLPDRPADASRRLRTTRGWQLVETYCPRGACTLTEQAVGRLEFIFNEPVPPPAQGYEVPPKTEQTTEGSPPPTHDASES